MDARDGTLKHLDKIAHEIIDDWYERSKENYVTQEDSLQLGVEPEVKRFHRKGNHRVKFARRKELDVTYGLGAYSTDGMLMIEASVNNKSAGFDYDLFVEKLKAYYWGSRHEKPWTDPEFDHFSYADLVHFDPRMSHSVSLDIRKDKADIIRLGFALNPSHRERLMKRRGLLFDLIENYCLAPLKRIYAESYREL